MKYPVVKLEMKEYLEFDMQMTKIMNPDITNWKLDIVYTPQPSDQKSLLDLWLACCNEIKHMIQIKSHEITVTNTFKETKPKSRFV